MKRRTALVFLAGIAVLLTGCASGPKFDEVAQTLTKASPDTGRIYVYRTAVVGAAVQPEVKLNGEVVGRAKPKGFFVIDRPAGNYEIMTSTEVDRKLSLAVEPGQTRYVRLNISIGFLVGHVYPELVEPSVGEEEIKACSYTGQPVASAASQ